MKKLLFLLAVFCTLKANAQPYSIIFAGAGLSSVKVENLTSGLIVNLNIGDVLHLSTITGIPEVNNLKSSGLKVYPNPMTDKSTLEILPPVAGDAIISVCDMTGKVIIQFKGYVDNSIQEFSLSGIKNGLHIINILGNGYQFSEKLLSNGKSNGTANIVRVSNNIQIVSENKSINNSKGVQATIDMAYTAGERLKYTAISGNNSTVMTDIPTADNTVTFTFTDCKDGDNNYYPVVTINTQVWMAENLKTTKFRNVDLIRTTTPATLNISGESAPKYQWAYEGNEGNANTYGRLYTWYAVTDSRNICPIGWHVPTDAEWITLENYLGGQGEAGGRLKEIGIINWVSPNVGATDEVGFTALPCGSRSIEGTFKSYGSNGNWWSSTKITVEGPHGYFSTGGWSMSTWWNISGVISGNSSREQGLSVRCIKNVVPTVNTYSVSAISLTTALIYGKTLFDGGDSIIAYGFCWSKSGNPTISDNKITVAPGSETNFITQISGLIENTTYYVRAFAANSEGIGYGNVISFTTQNINNNPILFNPNLTYGTVTVKTACNPVCKTKKLLVIY